MQAPHTPAQQQADPPSRRVDGKPETDADRRFFDLRQAGYTGPIDQDGNPVADLTIPTVTAATVTEAVRSLFAAAPAVAPAATLAGTPAVTLRDAALYLDRHGWIQGAYYDATAVVFTPAACMVGAIGMVCYGGPVEAPAQVFGQPGFEQVEAALARLDSHLTQRVSIALGYDEPHPAHEFHAA